ncbi:MAG TPA: SRPBCC family protein, partial [Burkholderiaceae bacterium]|nr:SRPBCC family protein [Burkholderiaceae bacterium]
NLVFDALTEPELVKRWLLGPPGWSMPVCGIDLKVGGSYRYVWRKADGTEMGMGGVYREIVRPERLVHTELFDQDWTGGETVVTTELTEQGGKTVCSAAILYATREARDGAHHSGMEQGVTTCYDRLDELLASQRVRKASSVEA